MTEDHEHEWEFQGVVYSECEYTLPGSGARSRIYEDAYFCVKCLKVVYKNSRRHGNTYEKPLPNTFPK